MFLKQCDGTEFGWPGSAGLKKASLLSSSPNTSHLVGHRLDFDTSLDFRTALTFQKYCHRHGIVLLIWQDTILFTTTVTYGGGGGGEMGGKGGWFAFLLSSLFFFFCNTVIHCNHSLNKLGSHRDQMSKPGFDSNSPMLAFGCAISLFPGSQFFFFFFNDKGIELSWLSLCIQFNYLQYSHFAMEDPRRGQEYVTPSLLFMLVGRK